MDKILNDKRIAIIVFLVVFLTGAISGCLMDVPVSMDEVGTLSNATLLMGNNWGDYIASTGGYYYKYGLAILYLPIIYLVKDVYLLYKLMLIVNAIMTAFIGVIAYFILRKHLKMEDKLRAGIIALVVGLLPTVLLYAGYPRGDIILIFMPWLIVYFMLEASVAETKKKRMLFSGIVAFSACFSFMSHNRGIVAVIACFMTIALIRMFYKKYILHIPTFFITTAGMLALDRVLSHFFKMSIWGDGARQAAGEYLSLSSLKQIFTAAGLRAMIRMCIGWMYNLFSSTFGLVVIGFLVGIIICFRMLKKKKEDSIEEGIVSVFSVLLFLGSFALGVLFFFMPVKNFFENKAATRADRVLFDRYMVSTIGPLCLLALYALQQKRKVFTVKLQAFSVVASAGLLYLFMHSVAPWLVGRSFDRKYIIGLNLFMEYKEGTTIAKISGLTNVFWQTGLLALAIMIGYLVLHKLKWERVALIGLIGLFIWSYCLNFSKAKVPINDSYYEKTKVNVFLNEFKEIAEEYPYVLCDSGTGGGKSWQYVLPEFSLITSSFDDLSKIEDMIIIAGNTFLNKDYYDNDYYVFNDIDYTKDTRNLPYIKGDSLNSRLNELGYQTKKVSPVENK